MKNLKVLTANIALGNPHADNLVANLRALTMFCGWRIILFSPTRNFFGKFVDYSLRPRPGRLEYFKRTTSLKRTFELIRNRTPDLLVVNELIREAHEEEAMNELRQLGYKSFAWGEGAKVPDLRLATLIASRLEALPVAEDLHMPFRDRMGGGAGAVYLRLKEEPITFIGCHLTYGIPDLFVEQVRALVAFAKSEESAGRQVVMGGDFNARNVTVQKTAGFSALSLKTVTDQRTCPTCVPSIFRTGIDHIFVPKDWQVISKGFHAFGSDHLAVSAEVSIP